MAEKKYLNEDGLARIASHVNIRLKKVDTMPLTADADTVLLYVGTTTSNYVKGHVYQFISGSWQDINNISASEVYYDNVDSGLTSDNVNDVIDELQGEINQLSGGIVPKGTITFNQLPALTDVEIGWMYNISDDFTTTNDFVVPGVSEKAGSNVYCADIGSGVKKWDVFAVVDYSASNIDYDNTASGLTATNVQSAIDEIEGSLSTVAKTGSYDDLLDKPTLGTAAEKDYTTSVIENSGDLVTSGGVKSAIDSAISSVYKPAGNKTCAELVAALLVSTNLGNVYNMTDSGTTTADFVEGAGKTIEIGDNVVIVDVGTAQLPDYKFDLLSGFIDLSDYARKSEMSVTPGTGTDADKTTIQLKTGTSATVLTQHIPASSATPQMDGTGSAGTSTDYARADHVHPSDTSKVNVSDVVDKVEDGNSNPVTSNAVADSLDVPDDAILHYSFDDVPDYPDGTAFNYYNNNFVVGDWLTNQATLSVTDGKMKVAGNANYIYALIRQSTYTLTNLLGKIVKAKIFVHSANTAYDSSFRTAGNDISGNVIIAKEKYDQWIEVTFAINTGTASNQWLGVVFPTASADNYWQIEVLYIGDGSYNTPIIDNSGNGNNATNSGALAIQGISGKGIFFLENAQKKIPVPVYFIRDYNKWSISFWVNLREGQQATGQNPRIYQFGNFDYCFISNFYKGYSGADRYIRFYTYYGTGNYVRVDTTSIEQFIGQTIHITVVNEIDLSGTSKKTIYINGKENVTVSTTALTQRPTLNDAYIGGTAATNQFLENSMIDDFQIFNRALSLQEVQALYLNKANTPKYYDLNNYRIDNADTTPTQNSTNLVQSGGVYNAIDNVIYDTSITDCNNAFEKGKTRTYWLETSVTNIPNTNNGWYIISQCNTASLSANNYVTQIATVASNVAKNEMYIRHAYVSSNVVTWSNWEKLVKEIDLANALAVPTDAVLHYSFDDVPDYPDGTAIEKHIKDFTSVPNGWDTNNRGVLSVSNGELVNTATQRSNCWIRINKTLSNAIVKVKVRFNIPCTVMLTYYDGSAYKTLQQYLYTDTMANTDYILIGLVPSTNYVNIQFYVSETTDFQVILSEIYIGDGSYNTPIIDNSGNGINATNNGGIAVQGVSGKGLYFLNGKYASIGTDYQLNPNFSVSLWVNPDNNTQELNGTLVNFVNQFSLRNGYAVNKLEITLFDSNGDLLISNGIARDLLPANKWSHIVVTRNGVYLRVFVDGIRVITFTLNNSTIGKTTAAYLSSSYLSRPQSIDDLLIFNRALSAEEVNALYLNKANTPKYYDLNNYRIDNNIQNLIFDDEPIENSNNPVTSGGLYESITKNDLNDFVVGTNIPTVYQIQFFNVIDFCVFNGNLYAATTKGLYVSSDGLNFVKNESFSDNNIQSLYSDDETLYVGTDILGLYTSTDGTTFTHNTSFPNNISIKTIYKYNGNTYLGTYFHGLYVSSDGSTFTQNTSVTTSFSVTSMCEYKNKLYISFVSYGVSVSSDGNSFTSIVNSISCERLIEYKDKLYVGTIANGLYVLSSDESSFISVVSMNTGSVYTLENFNNKLYIGKNDGLYVSTDGTNFAKNQTIPSNEINKLYLFNNIFGAYRRYLYCYVSNVKYNSDYSLGLQSQISFFIENYFRHDRVRMVPKDITQYFTDGTFYDRLNGTNGFSLFEDIYPGDYFQMSTKITAYEQTKTYQADGSQYVTIAGLDTLWGNGDNNNARPNVTYHHAILVPGKGLDTSAIQHFGRSRMNSTDTATGGYVGSEMNSTTIGPVITDTIAPYMEQTDASTAKKAYSSGDFFLYNSKVFKVTASIANGGTMTYGTNYQNATINEQLKYEFGSHLKTVPEILSNAINATSTNNKAGALGAGVTSGWAWTSVQAVLMSEVEVYGSTVWSSSAYDTGTAKVQLPLFRETVALNNRTAYWWLKDVVMSTRFASVSYHGNANYNIASSATIYVRPRFVIGS